MCHVNNLNAKYQFNHIVLFLKHHCNTKASILLTNKYESIYCVYECFSNDD